MDKQLQQIETSVRNKRFGDEWKDALVYIAKACHLGRNGRPEAQAEGEKRYRQLISDGAPEDVIRFAGAHIGGRDETQIIADMATIKRIDQWMNEREGPDTLKAEAAAYRLKIVVRHCSQEYEKVLKQRNKSSWQKMLNQQNH
jgi:hypothetical protein